MARGLGQTENNSREYVSCSNGVFVKRMKEPTKDTITRKLAKGPNIGNEIHELHFQKIEGLLVNVEKREHKEFGDSWNFIFDVSITPDNPKELVLGLKCDSGYAKGVIMRLLKPGVNFSEDVVLTAYSFTPEGESKERKGISMYQGGNKMLSAFTKEHPNGLPQMVQVTLNNKKEWDSTAQNIFLEEQFKKRVLPSLPGYSKETGGAEEPAEEITGQSVDLDANGLPF